MVYNLSVELKRKGHDIHIITRNPDGKYPAHQQLLPVHRFFIPVKESAGLFLSEIKNSYSIVKGLTHEIKFDILCIHQSMAAIGPLLSCKFKNIHIIYYYHSPWHEEFLIKKSCGGKNPVITDRAIASLMRWTEKQVLTKSSKIIVLSRYMKDRVFSIHNCGLDKLKVIPGGIDLNCFNFINRDKAVLKKQTNYPSDKKLFLTIRNLVPRMGLETRFRIVKNNFLSEG